MNIRELNEALEKFIKEDFNSDAIYAIHSLLEILKKRLLDMKAEVEELYKIEYKDRRETQQNRLYNVEYLADALRYGYDITDDEDMTVPGIKQAIEIKIQLEKYIKGITDGMIKAGKQLESRLQKISGELSSLSFDAETNHDAEVSIFTKHVDEIVALIDKANKDYFEKTPYNRNIDTSIIQETL